MNNHSNSLPKETGGVWGGEVRAHKMIVLSGTLHDERNLNIIVNRKVYYVNYDHIMRHKLSILMCIVTIGDVHL